MNDIEKRLEKLENESLIAKLHEEIKFLREGLELCEKMRKSENSFVIQSNFAVIEAKQSAIAQLQREIREDKEQIKLLKDHIDRLFFRHDKLKHNRTLKDLFFRRIVNFLIKKLLKGQK